MEERPPEPPAKVIETQAGPVEVGGIPPFEPLLEQPLAIEPAPAAPAEGPISAPERERAAARAAAACTQGRLSLGAYSDLVEIFQQTPERGAFEGALQELRAAETAAVVPGGARTTSSLVAVLSGHDQKGAMRLGPAITLAAVLGGVDLDLREATVSGPVTTIRAFTVLGGVDVRIPPGVRVETTSIPILAGNDVSLREAAPRPDAPVIRFEMISVLGGIDVKDHGGMKDLIRQRSMLAAAGMSEAQLRLQESRIRAHAARHAAHRAAREARRQAHWEAHQAQRDRHR